MTILGDALSLNGRVEDAVEAYRSAIKRSPKDVFAAGRLAQAYLSLGDAKSAFEQADKIASNPRFHSLTRLLRLGHETLAVLPRYDGKMAELIAVSAHGRPMIVNDQASTAPLVFAPTGWCAVET
jgi:tetratricopeptide (TPR) repeat protein